MLCARKNEGLFQHLINVGELSRKIILETKVVHRIAESFSENFAELAYYSGVFHDVGKILYSFQKPLDKKCSEKDLSFPGHEVLSAFIASRLMEYLDFFNDLEKASVVKVILYHHQGLRDVKVATELLVNKIKVSRGKEPLIYYNEALTLFNQLTKKVDIDINIEEFLKNIENNLMSLDVRKVLKREFDRYNEILSNLTRSELQRYTAFRRILTGIILISDTYVASRVDKISSIYAQDIYVFLSQFR